MKRVPMRTKGKLPKSTPVKRAPKRPKTRVVMLRFGVLTGKATVPLDEFTEGGNLFIMELNSSLFLGFPLSPLRTPERNQLRVEFMFRGDWEDENGKEIPVLYPKAIIYEHHLLSETRITRLEIA